MITDNWQSVAALSFHSAFVAVGANGAPFSLPLMRTKTLNANKEATDDQRKRKDREGITLFDAPIHLHRRRWSLESQLAL